MKPIDKRILDFIMEHHVLSLAVSTPKGPWCASCFYVYIKEMNRFILTSDPDTRHIQEIVRNNSTTVAGTIALETKVTGKIRGIQFTGQMKLLQGEELKVARQSYIEKFPVARFIKLYLWGLQPDHIKMTDNRLGFGKKLVWQG
jgi:uncharacterized protein YhbP (UPF0306 family)